MTEDLNRINKIMSELVGIEMTYLDLDMNNPADFALYVLVTQFDRNQQIVLERAASIIKDMHRVLAGQTPGTLASSSDGRRYDAAVSAMDTLRAPIQMAAVLYKTAHNLTTAA